MVVLTYISLKGVGLGFNHGRIWGERFTGSKPPTDFFTIHNKIQCHVMSKPKPQSESQNSIFLWLCLWFNSNVDAIITNLFCEHAFCQDSSRKQNNPTSASSVIIFINPT